MKLLRYGKFGQEKPGILDAAGKIRDLSGVLPDLGPSAVTPEGLARLKALAIDSLPVVAGSPRYGTPLSGIGKFIAVGLNYSDHAAESNMPVPSEPVLFTKATSCIVGPNDPVVIPQNSGKTDWEVELGVVIGTTARYVAEESALSYVAGYVLINDVSERHFQLERGSQWDRGKGCDTFGPIGPWLVTADEIPAPQTLSMWLDID
ncbi:MAG TPA: fumarylacetoacetate hydrolase family protein, partial [Bryobacteraceae bacterium]|nr:fumarylacetoacetate hydrolase family protein [Bryobacteraceae bacterium]